MTDMIERVARAINAAITWEIASCMDEGVCKRRDKSCGCTTILARAAIAAMRDPTKKMIMARLEAQLHPTGFAPRVEWQAMIDAALEEKK